jgi:hypothetical protein
MILLKNKDLVKYITMQPQPQPLQQLLNQLQLILTFQHIHPQQPQLKHQQQLHHRHPNQKE